MGKCVSLEVAFGVTTCAGLLRSGLRGGMRSSAGMSLYDLHTEVPFDGIGVPHAAIPVVTTDADGKEAKLPLREWARVRRRAVRCARCGLEVLGSGAGSSKWTTPERVEQCERWRAEMLRLSELLRTALAQRGQRSTRAPVPALVASRRALHEPQEVTHGPQSDERLQDRW